MKGFFLNNISFIRKICVYSLKVTYQIKHFSGITFKTDTGLQHLLLADPENVNI